MTAKAQSEGIPQDTAPSRYSLVSIARNVSIFLFLCGMIAVQVQPTQNLSGERAHQTAVVNEDLLNTVQLKAPLVNAVKGIRAHRRLLSEDQEELDDSEYPSKSTRRLKGKGGRGRNGGRSKGRSGRSKGKKGRSKGSKGSKGSGRFSRSQTFSPFPTETPFPTSTPFPTVTPFPTITPYPTATPWPTWTPFPTTFAGNSPPPTPTTTVVTTAPTTATTAPSVPGATVAPTASTTAPTAATA